MEETKKDTKVINKQINYNIDERILDVRLILNGKNVEIVKFIPPKDLTFPKDYLDISSNGKDKLEVYIAPE